MTSARRALRGVVACALLAGCAATRPTATPGDACPGLSSLPPEAAICGRDQAVRTLRARFRAEVQTADASRSAEGVLVWRAPGRLRVKLFTLAGLTVYDATWVGDQQRVRGVVRQPLADRVDRYDLGPGEVPDAPEADLALVLWALWQPRCTKPPAAGEAGRYGLDPLPARTVRRDVVVAEGGIAEEVLLRPRAADAAGAPSASGAGEDRVQVRYAAYECAQQPPLPRRIDLDAASRGWRAHVTIVEQARNVELDDGLFDVGDGPGAHGGG